MRFSKNKSLNFERVTNFMNGYLERWSVTGYREHDVDGIIIPAAYSDPDDG